MFNVRFSMDTKIAVKSNSISSNTKIYFFCNSIVIGGYTWGRDLPTLSAANDGRKALVNLAFETMQFP